jgi:hypothetical protein
MDFWKGVIATEKSRGKYISRLVGYAKVFGPYLDKYPAPDTVVEVGGGLYGGMLYGFEGGKHRILIDLLIDDFKLLEGFEFDLVCVKKRIVPVISDFADIDLIDGCATVVFCLDALDHCLTRDHFDLAQAELVRILAPGGLLCFYLAKRTKPQVGHTVIVPKNEIRKGFASLETLKEFDSYYVGRKPDAVDRL